jgi:predicted 3-demethylubiquinone-9 3-methyltransferase (glyoxalase superfamily)
MELKHPITPCLWFDDQGEEAARFYTGIFPNSRISGSTRYGEAGKEFHQKPVGSALTIEFELNGQPFLALNGGPNFTFNEAVSFQVFCESQEEIDYYWEKLSAGGDENAKQCGWLKDRYGLSWQVVPTCIIPMLQDPDTEKSGRAMSAMMEMKKMDIAELERAYSG